MQFCSTFPIFVKHCAVFTLLPKSLTQYFKIFPITAVVVHASAYSTDEINTENGYVDSAFNNETFYFDSHLYEWSSGETDYLNVSIKKVNYFTPDGTILQDYKLLDIYPSSFEEIVNICNH